jgi:hypothetical protein
MNFFGLRKYRPKTIEDCIFLTNIKKTFLDFLDKGEVPNLLLAGPAGCGKTTVAKALCNRTRSRCIMSSMDPMKDDSWILSETLRKTSLRPSHFLQLQNTKSSSLMRQITQPTMYNSSYGRLLRSLVATADSSLPAISKTKSFEPLHSRCACIDFSTNAKDKPQLAAAFFKRIQQILDTESVEYDNKVLVELSTNTSLTGDGFLMSVNVTLQVVRLTLAFLQPLVM